MHRIAIVLGVMLPLASSARGDAPPSERVAIDILTVNGTGCPRGSVIVEMSPDNTWFRVGHSSSYMALVGIGARPTDFRKNCQLNLVIRTPSGMTYAIASVDHQAFVSLAPGASARHRANFFFSGQPASPLVDHAISDRQQGEWQATDTFEEPTLLFAFCNIQPAITLSTELRAIAGTSDTTTTTSYVSMVWGDDVGSGPTIYHLVWRHCG